MVDVAVASREANEGPGVVLRWRWIALFAILACEIMDVVDSTVLEVALPTIRRDLHVGTATFQWIAASYSIALAVGLLPGARLGDIYGRKRVFLGAMSGFIISSVLCATAPSGQLLIVYRLTEGLSAGLMMPQVLAVIRSSFPPKQVAMASGLVGPLVGLSAAIAPALGGSIIGANILGLSWRAVFFLNVPIGLLALVGTMLLVKESRAPQRITLDWVGTITIAAVWVGLLYPITVGHDDGWPLWTFGCMAASLVLLGVFIVQQRRRAGAGLDPLLVLGLFRRRTFNVGLVVVFAFMASMAGMFFTISLYLQIGLGFSAARAGLVMMPWAFGIVVGVVALGGLSERIGSRWVIQIGMLLQGVGVFLVYLTSSHQHIGYWQLQPGLVLAGIGMGAVIAPLFGLVLVGVQPDQIGSGSGMLNSADQLANACGIAVIGTVFFAFVNEKSAEGARVAYTYGLRQCAWITLAAYAVTIAITFALPRNGLTEDEVEAASLPEIELVHNT